MFLLPPIHDFSSGCLSWQFPPGLPYYLEQMPRYLTSLDKASGSRFQSKNEYLLGRDPLVPGTVTACYVIINQHYPLPSSICHF